MTDTPEIAAARKAVRQAEAELKAAKAAAHSDTSGAGASIAHPLWDAVWDADLKLNDAIGRLHALRNAKKDKTP